MYRRGRGCTSGHLSDHPLYPMATTVPVTDMGCTSKAHRPEKPKNKSKKREVKVLVAKHC